MNYEKGTPEWILQDSCILYCKARKMLIEAEAAYKDLDSQTKTNFAFAMLKSNPKSSVEMQKTQAYTDADYIKHLEVVAEAHKIYLSARGTADIEDKRWETARSLLSMEKAKANIR